MAGLTGVEDRLVVPVVLYASEGLQAVGDRFGDHGTRAERSVVADVSTPAMGQLAQQFLHCGTGPVGCRGRPA